MRKEVKEETSAIDKLIRYVRGELSAEDEASVRLGIRRNPESAEIVAILKDMRDEIADSSSRRLLKPAHALLGRMLRDARKAKRSRSPHGLLTFDSGLLPLPQGVRPATVETRRVRYRLGQRCLEMSFYPVSADSYEIIGQLEDWPGERGLNVTLKGGRTRFETAANQFGLFRFGRVPAMDYRMKITSDKETVGTVDIEL